MEGTAFVEKREEKMHIHLIWNKCCVHEKMDIIIVIIIIINYNNRINVIC